MSNNTPASLCYRALLDDFARTLDDFFAGAFLAVFLTTLAVLTALSTSSTDGNLPNAASAGFAALNATGISAPSSEYASVFGSVTPEAYIAVAAPSTDLPYDASIAFSCFVFIFIPPRI